MAVIDKTSVQIAIGSVRLLADLTVPERARGLVAFAHGTGSSRLSPRNRYVADTLVEAGLGTLLLDLLTAKEEEEDEWSREYRFDIERLAERLVAATDWLLEEPRTRGLSIGYFGASTGAAAAIRAAAERATVIRAVVSRGGRPDLAGEEALQSLSAPTLLIVGGDDEPVIRLNEKAEEVIRAPKRIHIVRGATHLFEEPGALQEVARLAREWFLQHLAP